MPWIEQDVDNEIMQEMNGEKNLIAKYCSHDLASELFSHAHDTVLGSWRYFVDHLSGIGRNREQ
jgi:hypothetical protein